MFKRYKSLGNSILMQAKTLKIDWLVKKWALSRNWVLHHLNSTEKQGQVKQWHKIENVFWVGGCKVKLVCESGNYLYTFDKYNPFADFFFSWQPIFCIHCTVFSFAGRLLLSLSHTWFWFPIWLVPNLYSWSNILNNFLLYSYIGPIRKEMHCHCEEAVAILPKMLVGYWAYQKNSRCKNGVGNGKGEDSVGRRKTLADFARFSVNQVE